MKIASETHALEKLHQLKSDFAARIRTEYEHLAKSCATCETPGACCLDAHFVNVQITRLEAAAVRRVLDDLPNRDAVMARVERAIDRFDLAQTMFTKCGRNHNHVLSVTVMGFSIIL